jgi:hypothetical protein
MHQVATTTKEVVAHAGPLPAQPFWKCIVKFMEETARFLHKSLYLAYQIHVTVVGLVVAKALR